MNVIIQAYLTVVIIKNEKSSVKRVGLKNFPYYVKTSSKRVKSMIASSSNHVMLTCTHSEWSMKNEITYLRLQQIQNHYLRIRQ